MQTRKPNRTMPTLFLGTMLSLSLLTGLASCSVDYVKIETDLKGLDASGLPDGGYEGSARIFPVNVKVLVHVTAGKITSIDLIKHFNGRGKAAESILDSIIQAQSTAVDVVAGATQSSLTILQAVENALAPRG